MTQEATQHTYMCPFCQAEVSTPSLGTAVSCLTCDIAIAAAPNAQRATALALAHLVDSEQLIPPAPVEVKTSTLPSGAIVAAAWNPETLLSLTRRGRSRPATPDAPPICSRGQAGDDPSRHPQPKSHSRYAPNLPARARPVAPKPIPQGGHPRQILECSVPHLAPYEHPLPARASISNPPRAGHLPSTSLHPISHCPGAANAHPTTLVEYPTLRLAIPPHRSTNSEPSHTRVPDLHVQQTLESRKLLPHLGRPQLSRRTFDQIADCLPPDPSPAGQVGLPVRSTDVISTAGGDCSPLSLV
jgi:hypothetical protein